MPYPPSLCNVCITVDFPRHVLCRMSRNIILGTWGAIVQTPSCPFCRLVVHSLRTNCRQALLHPSDRIILRNHPSWELGVEMSPYDRLKSECFSNTLDLRSRAKQCQDVAYRFVVSVEENPEVQAYIQYIAPQEHSKDDRQFFGRKMDREKVNIRLLKSWLKRCDKWHDDICEKDGSAGRRLPYNLRVIDVENRTIITVLPGEGIYYLTLSYVWGTEDMERSTGKKPVVINRADVQMTKDGKEVTPLPEPLPKTIEDAIFLTEALGYKYLWVDALCIVQDDPLEEKRRQLDRMDAIYNCSALTIAAASGRHADSGIPGISVPRGTPQYSELVEGLQLATMSPSFCQLEDSQTLIWNTRGWTFQEKILAKRILLFTDCQVYYRCSESIWTEEIVMETERLSKSIESRKAKYRWAVDRPLYVPDGKSLLIKLVLPHLNVDDQWNYLGMFPDYASAVREYTQRTLTKPSDTLIAINGIFRTLQPDSGEFYFGLPSAYFLQALLWYPEPGSRHIRTNPELPSWTWASWQVGRGVSYDVLDVRMLRAIVITLRKFFVGVGHALSAPNSSSSSSSTDTGSTNSGSSPSYGSSPSSSSSTPWKPSKKRDWSTISIIKRATMNVSSCFGWPLLVRDHTVKEIFLCFEGSATLMNYGEPFALSTFMEDGSGSECGSTSTGSFTPNPRSASYSEHRYHQRLASKLKVPLLSMKTVILRFSIGSCLHYRDPHSPEESSVFELLDATGLCVGEVWTTLEKAHRGRETPLEFVTISWGLSLTVAEVAQEYVPRWTFDAADLPEAKEFVNWKGYLAEALQILSAPKTGLGRGVSGEGVQGKGARGTMEQPTAMAFMEALFKAKKGEARPKFLWSTVNLILIEREGVLARRVGVGKVIFRAWLELWDSPEEVLLA